MPKGGLEIRKKQLFHVSQVMFVKIIHTTKAFLTITVYIHCRAPEQVGSKAWFRRCCPLRCPFQKLLLSAAGWRWAAEASAEQIPPGCSSRPEPASRSLNWFYFSLKKQTNIYINSQLPTLRVTHTAAKMQTFLKEPCKRQNGIRCRRCIQHPTQTANL